MIEKLVLPYIGANCYVVICDVSKKAILIDPGSGSRMILERVKDLGVQVEIIVLTHGHFDHIGAVEEVRHALGAKVAIHTDDADMLSDPSKNVSALFGSKKTFSAAEILLEDGQEICVGNKKMKVIHTPGHTPGGICLLDEADNALFSGDTLFCGAIGRSDFPGGDLRQLINGIESKLMVLDDGIRVFPGHEASTTIGQERRYNPFLMG
ncbi:MBL fold metallo-hydrolase [Dehalobacter sp. DCM]|uniref:MBL fold metallo-hydrolase n=1 Tax=Dehalobacter sp. DCM TaxID=2907827 RepID=UPI0030813CF9|nr:MBL fold metallo-hydrolase [Dehalobacter sp. DCM]